MENKEKIRIYLGYAPGKTTALNGLLMRALGAGKKIKIILFLKCPENTSESNVYKILKDEYKNSFEYYFFGASRIRKDGSFRFIGDNDGWLKEDEKKLNDGLKELEKDLSEGYFDFLCIDEITDLIYYKKINEDYAKKVFLNFHPNTTIFISGHKCPDWLCEIATTVIEGKLIKHYKGYTLGIEY